MTYKEVSELIERLETKIDDKFGELDKKYPSKESFRVVQIIAFSIVGSIALAFLNNLIQQQMPVTTNYIPVITPIVRAIGRFGEL